MPRRERERREKVGKIRPSGAWERKTGWNAPPGAGKKRKSRKSESRRGMEEKNRLGSVSYTHLDVYKRQVCCRGVFYEKINGQNDYSGLLLLYAVSFFDNRMRQREGRKESVPL